MGSSVWLTVVGGRALAVFCVISGLLPVVLLADSPRCEFALEPHAVDKLVRCYSLDNLTLLESFIEDERPVKVQVVNGPLDTFHLSSRGGGGE